MNGITVTGGKQAAGVHEVREIRGAGREKELEQKQSSEKPAGVENGQKKPRYDEYLPEKKTNPSGKKEEETYTVNTDQADQEIKKLEEKKSELERRVSQEQEGSTKWKKLKRQLEQIEAELERKDTDSYRKQHAKQYRAMS